MSGTVDELLVEKTAIVIIAFSALEKHGQTKIDSSYKQRPATAPLKFYLPLLTWNKFEFAAESN